jgi:hypothetical protein
LKILASILEGLNVTPWEVMPCLEQKGGTWTFKEAGAGATATGGNEGQGEGAAGGRPGGRITLFEAVNLECKWISLGMHFDRSPLLPISIPT